LFQNDFSLCISFGPIFSYTENENLFERGKIVYGLF